MPDNWSSVVRIYPSIWGFGIQAYLSEVLIWHLSIVSAISRLCSASTVLRYLCCTFKCYLIAFSRDENYPSPLLDQTSTRVWKARHYIKQCENDISLVTARTDRLLLCVRLNCCSNRYLQHKTFAAIWKAPGWWKTHTDKSPQKVSHFKEFI